MAVITFSEDGAVEFTRKPEMLALFEGEKKQIDRMTDIIHHPETDRYYFKFLTGPFAGRNFNTVIYRYVDSGEPSMSRRGYTPRITDEPPVTVDTCLISTSDIYSVFLTETYEDCAKLEVWFVDWMRRLMGESMADWITRSGRHLKYEASTIVKFDKCVSHRAEGIHLDPCCPFCEAPAE